MAFKSRLETKFSFESPEALLHDLRANKIQGPLSHQADMWRNYTICIIIVSCHTGFYSYSGSI